jgi:hypothetical protein
VKVEPGDYVLVYADSRDAINGKLQASFFRSIEEGSIQPDPDIDPEPEPEPEPEQGGIPGFPSLAIIIGIVLSLFFLKFRVDKEL